MTSRELMAEAMALGTPSRVPVMCQLSIGHTLLQTGVHPIDFYLLNEVYVDALLDMRDRYRFDGILLHKAGRDNYAAAPVTSVDRDSPVPAIHLEDGSRIDCTRDDDPQYRPGPGFQRPEDIHDVDPDGAFAWAPDSYVRWCEHKGSGDYRTAESIPAHWLAAIDRVREKTGTEFSLHGETRSVLDHLFAITGMEEGLMALLTEPAHARILMDRFTEWSVAWAVAQVRRGCDAIKITSPFSGAGFISREMYREWVLPYERRIAEVVRGEGACVYTHTCGAIGDRLDLLAETAVNGVEALDPPPLGTVELSEAKDQLRDRLFIKGNVNPVRLKDLSREQAREEVERVYAVGAEGGQYILSSACSISPATPPENVEQLAACVYAHATRA